jgi:cyanophycinase-like exopeptidase
MTAVGSLDALRGVLTRHTPFALSERADIVLVPTASAFSGAEAAAIELASLFETHGAKVEALMNISRDSSNELYFAQRVRDADLVVLSDGSPLHAKSVWRATLIGDAIRDGRDVVTVGAVGSVLGGVMVDPRGGAPTNGLGYVSGLVVGVRASEEQLTRTRSLLGEDATFAVLGPEGVVHFDGEKWRAETADVVTTRGVELVEL